jgi:peptidyl-dipeptidase A
MRPSIRNLGILVACAAGGAAGVAAAAGKRAAPVQKEAEAFLATVTGLIAPVANSTNIADWLAATDVTPEHTGQRSGADKALASLIGSTAIIDKTKTLLKSEKQLDDLTARQLRKLLLNAAEAPGTIPEVVARRVELEAKQSGILDGYTFCLQPKGNTCAKAITANDIDDILKKSRDLAERQRVWTVSKEIGRPLKPGLVELVKLRNQLAREMGYHSFFALKVADYGMTVDEMMKLLDDTLATTKPLYDGLHCWAKNQLATRYKRPAPRLIPAHWIGNRWAQSWPGMVEAASLDQFFKGASAESIVKSSESFYVSLGFPKLPPSFWERSDLYPVPPGVARKKNTHASAWHVDRAQDVRSLMSVLPNEQWFATSHHELGHIYYFLAYSRPEVPFLLREGANRAFHEAIGELAKLASQQTPYLVKVGVIPAGKEPAPAGWWDYVAAFQGVTPAAGRDPDMCDACTKTHINDDAAEYYDYALATLIKFQLHDHICTKILKQDVRACDYSGSKPVGDFLRSILALGATQDWRTVIKSATGESISPRALMAFYAPLLEDLGKRNAGKDCGR